MYDRNYGDNQLRFEPSGGLLHAALVMQDKETDSYWSIMTGDSIGGPFKDTPLQELSLGRKAQWKQWRSEHPDTLVLSVDGREHIENNPYDNYFNSETGYRDLEGADARLPTKEPVFAFRRGSRKFAVPHRAVYGGATFDLGDEKIFLFRPDGAAIFYSTAAFLSESGFENREGTWVEIASGTRFDPASGKFEEKPNRPLRQTAGFDTFWYTWSLTHPDTVVLE